MPRLLVINPNTTDSITALVATHVRAAVAADIELRAVSGRFGARYIASETAYAIAGHAALDCYAEHGADVDAVLLACFGDPGLFALREIAACPVVGLAEASMYAAAGHAGGFSIVTGGARWRPMLERLAAGLGYATRLASVRTVSRTGAAIAADPAAAIAQLEHECDAAQRRDGAGVVILGGAGLAGIAAQLAGRVAVPLIDSVEAGARHAERLLRGEACSYSRFAPGDRTPSIGLTVNLAGRLRD